MVPQRRGRMAVPRVNKMVTLTLMFMVFISMASARPLVRQIRSAHEFERLLKKHSTETGLPVIADFYSDGCGPCRMIAPAFKNLAKEVGQDKAVFVKIDTNAQHELSARYQVRSLPTFLFFYNGKKVNQFSGAGEQQLRQITQELIRRSQAENVLLTLDSLIDYYKEKDSTKSGDDIRMVYQKCADMIPKASNPSGECIGAAANQLARRLKKKYGTGPNTAPRFTDEDRSPGDAGTANKESAATSSSNKKNTAAPTLKSATMEDLITELERRREEEADAAAEQDDDDEDFGSTWEPGDFPERVTIIGGGPAGMAAALYAARAGLEPVVVAPPIGGQLQGKGVDVENYPGLANVTGPAVVSAMRLQASQFGAKFESDLVLKVDASQRPFRVFTNNSVIDTHAIIVATGAESNWLNVPGEWDLRGGGVSSCATCDGAAFYGRDVVVVGGGDSAMEDALVLARTSKSVTIIHRRDEFRASKILAERVKDHPSISIRWNSKVQKILGKALEPNSSTEEEDANVDLDDVKMVVSGVVLVDVTTEERSTLDCDAVFVAIGHTPSTTFLQGIVDFHDPPKRGYVKTIGTSTKTSVPGIFAAGDVADAVYRQAITSAGSGAAAALDAERWLSEEGLGNEAAEFEAELLAELMADSSKKTILDQYNVYEDAGGRMEGMKESVGAEL